MKLTMTQFKLSISATPNRPNITVFPGPQDPLFFPKNVA